MKTDLSEKLRILAESAKYDVSCSSGGVRRRGTDGAPGSTGSWGVCHSFTEDGRCVSLFKIMLTNYCIYDCAYCINRRRNDRPRTMLSTAELVGLTMEFYRRNYIEGLFLIRIVVMTPNPGRVKTIIQVPLGEERDRTRDDFLQVRDHVFEAFNMKHEDTTEYYI